MVSPVHAVELPLLKEKGIELLIKRDDLIADTISGNKYRKLYFNIIAPPERPKGIITFGGPFSNHIHAIATISNQLQIPGIAIIRGEIDDANPTISYCGNLGLTLIPVSRSAYQQKDNDEYIQKIIAQYADYLLIPEGGSNDLGIKGVSQILSEIEAVPYDVICCPLGTGGTTLGLIHPSSITYAYSALKTSGWTSEMKALAIANDIALDHVNLIEDYTKGYAKYDNDLIDFINWFYKCTAIRLDFVYTGKMMLGILDMIKNDSWRRGTTIMAYHSGGLQGNKGLEYRLQKSLFL